MKHVTLCRSCDDDDWLAKVIAERDKLANRHGPATDITYTSLEPRILRRNPSVTRRLYLWQWSSGDSVEMHVARADGIPMTAVTTTAGHEVPSVAPYDRRQRERFLRLRPTGAENFEFGWTIEDARRACAQLGGQWVTHRTVSRCDLVWSFIVLRFRDGHLCSVSQFTPRRTQHEHGWIAQVFDEYDRLARKYGPITDMPEVTGECQGRWRACVSTGELRRLFAWEWPSGHRIEVHGLVVQGAPEIAVTTTAPASR